MPFTKITLKNYRCFEASQPASIEVGKGITALVGPNNCGKSTFLRFFYEYRQLFQLNHQTIKEDLFTKSQAVTLSGVEDLQEIPCNLNERNGEIIISFEDSNIRLAQTETSLTSYRSVDLSFIWERKTPNLLTCQVFIDKLKRTSSIFRFSQSAQLRSENNHVLWLQPLLDEMNKLGDSIYFGPFRNVINQGGSDYFDLSVGDHFVKTWNSWKAGPLRERNRLIEKVTEDIRKIFSFKKLEINAAENGRELQVNVDGHAYKLRELGAGLAQFILVFANAAIKQPCYILIDEPELNLHPSLQIDFLTSLASYAKEGMIFCTHSIGLARSVQDRLYSLQRSDDGIKCSIFEQTPNYAEFVGEMSFSSFKELGFDRILLVEGQSEVKVMHQFLRMLKKDHQVVVIPLGGSQMIKPGVELELMELTRITKKVSALIDSEKSSQDSDLDQARKGFWAACKKIGIDLHFTERRATENYFTDAAIRRAINSNCRALTPYEPFTKGTAQWSKSVNWRIAREMDWEDIKDTDVGRFISRL